MSTVLQFHATWCQPCKRVTPILEEIAAERDDVELTRIDIEESPVQAADFGISSVPVIIRLDEDGNEVARVTGAKPKNILLQQLKLV